MNLMPETIARGRLYNVSDTEASLGPTGIDGDLNCYHPSNNPSMAMFGIEPLDCDPSLLAEWFEVMTGDSVWRDENSAELLFKTFEGAVGYRIGESNFVLNEGGIIEIRFSEMLERKLYQSYRSALNDLGYMG